MPIMAPLGDFAGVSRAMVVTAYESASGWMNLFTPTSAIVMGGLALSRVRYDRYLKFVAPLLGILLVLTCLFMRPSGPDTDGTGVVKVAFAPARRFATARPALHPGTLPVGGYSHDSTLAHAGRAAQGLDPAARRG
jgi:hypothetical protein